MPRAQQGFSSRPDRKNGIAARLRFSFPSLDGLAAFRSFSKAAIWFLGSSMRFTESLIWLIKEVPYCWWRRGQTTTQNTFVEVNDSGIHLLLLGHDSCKVLRA